MTQPYHLVHSFNHTADSEGNFEGLTKREYFAAMAMQGILGNHETYKLLKQIPVNDRQQTIAETALLSADALITELNKTKI